MKCIIWIVLTTDANNVRWVEAFIDEAGANEYFAFALKTGATGQVKTVEWENLP